MADIILIAVIIAVVGGACAYIYKAKKNGARCVGCSHAGCCNSKNSECSCHSEE